MVGYMRNDSLFLNFIQVSEPRPPLRAGELSDKVSATEELSREHAILMRLLIAIENVLVKASANVGTDLKPVHQVASMINDVVVRHHMAFEEAYIYPKATGGVTDLAKTLREQHDDAREAVSKIMSMTAGGKVSGVLEMGELVTLCRATDYLLRIHIAWEESVLFPALYDTMDGGYFTDLQNKMLSEERKLFGGAGLAKLYDELARVERAAGTDNPSLYTFKRV